MNTCITIYREVKNGMETIAKIRGCDMIVSETTLHIVTPNEMIEVKNYFPYDLQE